MSNDAALRTLAEQFQSQLKPERGPTPQIPYIMCAILVERDGIGCRAACRTVEGADEASASRVSTLAKRVRPLLARTANTPPHQNVGHITLQPQN